MDLPALSRAYRRRADAREAGRLRRFDELWEEVRTVGQSLRSVFGPGVEVYVFGSLLDRDRFRNDSDVDVAVSGLGPAEYWDAWALLESALPGARFDLVRLESAQAALREVILEEGVQLR